MKSKSFILVMLIVMLLSACSNNENPVGDPLSGTSWELVYYRKSPVIEGVTVTADFEEGQVKGSSGCNSYSGSYQVEGDKISFGPLMSTLMACLDPEGVMDQETMYLAWLQDAQTYQIQDDQLLIFRSDGEALTFVPGS
jgi:heat shock protein HslJ